MARTLLTLVVLVCLQLGPWPSRASETAIPLDPTLWSLYRPNGSPPPVFRKLPDGAAAIESRDGAGFFYRELAEGMPPARAGQLAWRWRVDRQPPASDPAVRGADDRPIALHLWFPRPETGLRDRLSELLGAPPVGYSLTYVFGGTAPTGSILENPYFDMGAIVVLRDGEAPEGLWMEERIDPAADFEAAFGLPAPPPSHIAISADTDDRGGISRAGIAELRWVPAAD